MSRIHWVDRGTGTPKDRDEVNKREVCECDGWVCDLDVMGGPPKLSALRNTVTLTRVRTTRLLGSWAVWHWTPCHTLIPIRWREIDYHKKKNYFGRGHLLSHVVRPSMRSLASDPLKYLTTLETRFGLRFCSFWLPVLDSYTSTII